ncbi:hypothetical protein [Paenibacillus sp. 481]|uniref:hypothetical protein n=1 Tax=Paenibacillus sp. 481 TaxID=2835869 RepID=UPI001E3A7873|nr:hypothetical protein [Paenibacillus sp. 481]UHA73167.1 hypothetical protein KIK04_21665 [Paenibacillus sp. 481]
MVNNVDEQFLRMIREQDQQEKEQRLEEMLSIPQVVAAVQAGQLTLLDEVIDFTALEVIPGQLSIRVPSTFEEMPESFVAIKYPAEQRPSMIYTDDTLSINVNVNPTEHKMFNDEMQLFHTEMLNMLKRMQPNATWLTDGVFPIGESHIEASEREAKEQQQHNEAESKQVGYYEFVTPAMDGNIYNLTFFMEWEEKGLFFSVNCMEKHMKRWRPIAHGIMASLRMLNHEDGEVR